MYPGWAIAFGLALNIGSAASAQQGPNRIDLDVSEAAPLPMQSASPLAISGITFRPVDVACPEEHGTIEIRSAQMYLSRINSRGEAGLHNKPLDDQTYRYEIGNAECSLALQVRLQTQHDGGWQPALLPYWSRPSIPKEERSALLREMMNLMKERREGAKSEPQSRPPLPSSQQMLGASGIGEAFFFEGSAKAVLTDCFQAVGSYDISREGVFFTFLRALPGNVNRFAIERDDINGFQGRLYFVGGGCRLQVTASGSRKYNSEWAPIMIDNPI